MLVAAALATAATSACAVGGAGVAPPPKPGRFLKADAATHAVTLTLIAGYPGTATEFNFDGYSGGTLKVTIPTGWAVTVDCRDEGSVAHSCAVTKGTSKQPVEATWSTSVPVDGIQPGSSEEFTFAPDTPATYRIACLVPGHEDSGMWVQLDVVAGGQPAISGS